MSISDLSQDTQTQLEAAVLRQLLAHFNAHPEVQNIDLMNLAGFCRNCLSKWYVVAAEEKQLAITYEDARERVYGMPYNDWKDLHQKPANADQLAAFTQRRQDTPEK